MGIETEIAWTDSTFNPWWGCFKISAGCKNCYADTFAKRVGLKVWGQDAEHRRFGDKHWREPEKWNRAAERDGRRQRVFCASMADVFEGRNEDADDRARLFALIEATPHLDWLLLTKRPQNMIALAPDRWRGGWPPNAWAGTTVEDQNCGDERVPELLKVPAQIRFLSMEPLIAPVIFRGRHWFDQTADFMRGGISWAIVGGESGHGARPFDVAWARSIRRYCDEAGVAYFFKQAGATCLDTDNHGFAPLPLKDRKGGNLDELRACGVEESVLARAFPSTDDTGGAGR